MNSLEMKRKNKTNKQIKIKTFLKNVIFDEEKEHYFLNFNNKN